METLNRQTHGVDVPLIRPRLLNELVLVPSGDELVVDGGHQLLALSGEDVRTILPRLLPLMDGHLSLSALERAVPEIPAERVRAAIGVLFGKGLLENEPSDDDVRNGVNGETLAFFRRFTGVTGVNQSGSEAYEKLRASRVLLVESKEKSPHLSALQSQLVDTGVGHVEIVAVPDLPSLKPECDKDLLVVSLSFSSEDYVFNSNLDDWCFANGYSWLRASLHEDSNYADLGPYFKPGEGACYRCFSSAHSRTEGDGTARPVTVRYPAAEFWTGMVGTEILYLLSRSGPLASARGFRRYELRDWSSKEFIVPRVLGCARCRPIADRQGSKRASVSSGPDGLSTVLLFEDYVASQSTLSITPKQHQDASRIGLSLAHQTKQLPICRQYCLSPELIPLGGTTLDCLDDHLPPSANGINIDQLATILRMTAGIREVVPGGGQVRRWAASGGNLGSTELFVVARCIQGLPPGIYFYQPHEHALALIEWREGGYDCEEFMRRLVPARSADSPDAMVLFTGAYHRVFKKYGPFGYRLVHLDAGAALSQLHMVAKGLGLRSWTEIAWADDLMEDALGLAYQDEIPTAVASLSSNRDPTRFRDQPAKEFDIRDGLAPTPVKPGRGFQAATVVEALYTESRRTEQELYFGLVPQQMKPRIPSSGRPLQLPKSVSGGESMTSVLARRATVRRYAADPVRLEQLSAMLSSAYRGDARDWPEEHRSGVTLEFQIVATRVDGVSPGVYAYNSGAHGLVPLRPALSSAEALGLFIQPELVSAPMQIWVIADLGSACRRHGAWGHRQLLLRAGAAANRLFLAGMATGIGGCILGGFLMGPARRHLDLDGYDRAALVVLTAGKPA